MRIINEAKFTPSELESYRKLVLHNLIQGMRKVIEAMRILDIPLTQEAFVCPLFLPYVSFYIYIIPLVRYGANIFTTLLDPRPRYRTRSRGSR